MIRSLRSIATKTLLISLSVAALSSCSMIKMDNDDCPSGLYVRFVYDYNTVRAFTGPSADLFHDHVCHVQLFVFDEEGRLVASRSVSNSSLSSPLAEYGYTIHFTENEVAPGHSYRLQAIAMDKDWDEALSTPGAKYRITASPYENENNLTITLDHAMEVPGDSSPLAVDDSAPLDILWHTLKVTPHDPIDGLRVYPIDRTTPPYDAYPAADQRVSIESEKATYATVSLIRDTKHLTVGLHQLDPEKRKHISADQFDLTITDANSSVDHSNAVNKQLTLRYTPYAAWTVCLDKDGTTSVESVSKGDLGNISRSLPEGVSMSEPSRAGEDDDNVVERQAHYNIMFNRLMLNSDENGNSTSPAMFEIKDKESGSSLVSINLPHYLAMGRDAYELKNYSHQEYLDRENDYHLDFFLNGSEFVALEIHVLSWSKRVQNIDF